MTKLPFLSLPLIEDGSANGVLCVPSTEGMAKGATIWLSANGFENQELIVDDILSSKQLAVKPANSRSVVKFDGSAYKLSLFPKITQPEQHSLLAPQQNPKPNLEDIHNTYSMLNTIAFLSSKMEILEKRVVELENNQKKINENPVMAIVKTTDIAKKANWFRRLINFILGK